MMIFNGLSNVSMNKVETESVPESVPESVDTGCDMSLDENEDNLTPLHPLVCWVSHILYKAL